MHLLRSRCCYYDNTLRRAVTDIESHRFTYSARAGPIERDCQGWLQQTSSHSRNRIRKRGSLSLFRHPAFGASRPDVGGIKSAFLRFQYQKTLSFRFDSTAPKARSSGEITRLDTATFRTTVRNTMAQVDASLANLVHGDALAKEHRPMACAPSGDFLRYFQCSGLQTRWAHRLQIYVPELWLRCKPRYVTSWLKRAGVSSSTK